MDHKDSPHNSAAPFRAIYEQYVEEASFLWLMRSFAVDQPHYNAEDVAELEQRIQGHLNGLITAPDLAWEICDQALELEGPGELFVAAYVAFTSNLQAHIQKVVEVGLATDICFAGLVSVFGWLPATLSRPWIERLLHSKDLRHKYLALAGCSIRRENPGEILAQLLQRQDCIRHKKLYMRALRLVGELKRHDLVAALTRAMQHEDSDVVFWASWSAVLLGDMTAISTLESYVFTPGSYQDLAIDMVFRVTPVDQSRQLIVRLAENPEQQRSVIRAVGVLGDPHAIDWLIAKTQDTKLTRLAGEAFSMITGIDLEVNQLNQAEPDDYQPVPIEDVADDNVALDDDENLPWPNPAALGLFWKDIRQQFINGQRYFLGAQIEPGMLTAHLRSATQRKRHAAALELALRDPAQVLLNTRSKESA